MIIWGWGRDAKAMHLGPTMQLVVTYRYIHVFWALWAAWGKRIDLATFTPEAGWQVRQVEELEAERFAGGPVRGIHPWKRYSLLAAIALIATLAAFGASQA